MAITLGNSNQGNATSGTTLTIALTCTGNFLIFGTYLATAAPAGTLTATYNGVSCTMISPVAIGTQEVVTLGYLVSPATGSSLNLIITSSKTILGLTAHASEWGGVDTTTPVGTPNSNSNTSGTSSSITVACATTDTAYAYVHHSANELHTPLNGQTEIFDGTVNSVDGYLNSPSTSQSMNWSWSTNSSWGSMGIALKPKIASSSFFMFF